MRKINNCLFWVLLLVSSVGVNANAAAPGNSGNTTPTATAIVMDTLAINEIIAYPIPASTTVRFSYKSDKTGEVTITVYNTNFRVVKELMSTTSTGEGTLTWDISDIAPGLYFYRVRIGDKQLSMKRLVIAR